MCCERVKAIDLLTYNIIHLYIPAMYRKLEPLVSRERDPGRPNLNAS